ncbi:MAG: glycosyltransferase family A protein [Chlamydiota bacterium]
MSPLRFFTLLFFLATAVLGFWLGKEDCNKTIPTACAQEDTQLNESQSFVIFVHAFNQELWCERSLRSIFEQEYENYRVIIIDDASSDETYETMRRFLLENHQEYRAILIRNETKIGPIASLYRAIDSCLDREIIVPLEGKDWLVHPMVLSDLSKNYQNPNIWLSFGQAVHYPSYDLLEPQLVSSKRKRKVNPAAPCSFYAGLFKKIPLSDLFKEGAEDSYLIPLLQMAGDRVQIIKEPIAFLNASTVPAIIPSLLEFSPDPPLAQFPKSGELEEKVVASF